MEATTDMDLKSDTIAACGRSGTEGATPDMNAYVTRYPDQGFTVAVLCNLDDAGSPGLAQGVADIYLSNALRPSVSSTGVTPPRVLSAGNLASKTGLYLDPLNGALVRIFARNGKLMEHDGAGEGEGVELTPVSANRVVVAATQTAIEFVPAVSGRTQEIHVEGSGHRSFVLRQVPTSFAPSRADLSTFAAQYTSPELEGTYTLAVHGSDLVIQTQGRAGIVLQPVFPDAFVGALVGMVRFSRDAGGFVTGFTVFAPGVRGMRFGRRKG
jgi:hypothetical protein